MLIDYEQEPEKITVTLIFEDKESQVSWNPKDMSLEDIKFMFMCSCESLCDTEFEILDLSGKVIDINLLNEFKNKSVFYIRKKQTNKISNLLFDGRRKLFVEIEPLRHIESQVAIKFMCIGSNLLKHTKKGLTHLRLFQLSNDLKRILWYTKSKTIDEASILIQSIKDITIGQVSENFINFPVKALEEFSFSIYYYNKDNDYSTLDLTCKNEKEFDLWVIGIKALYSHINGKIISKNDLLKHCKSYNEQIKKGNIANCSKFLFYNNSENKDFISKDNKSLESVMKNRDITTYGISKELLKICKKIEKLRGPIEDYKEKDIINNGVEYDGYQQLFDEEAIVEDLETQKNQMIKLFENCEKDITICLFDFFKWYDNNLNNTQAAVEEENKKNFAEIMVQLKFHYDSYLPSLKIINDINEKEEEEKIMNDRFLKNLDIQSWKIEVDLENIGDIINRFKASENPGLLNNLKSMFQGLI